jgi:hypothetical protein
MSMTTQAVKPFLPKRGQLTPHPRIVSMTLWYDKCVSVHLLLLGILNCSVVGFHFDRL